MREEVMRKPPEKGMLARGPEGPKDRGGRGVDVRLRGRPARDGDPHRRLALPRGAAQPAGAVRLHAGDNFPSKGVPGQSVPGESVSVPRPWRLKADEHLVQDHLVED